MPRFNFDVVGIRTVADHNGLIFADCQVAARFADNLAAELSILRPDLCEKACVMMSDERRNKLTYCVAIGARPKPAVNGPGTKAPYRVETKAAHKL